MRKLIEDWVRFSFKNSDEGLFNFLTINNIYILEINRRKLHDLIYESFLFALFTPVYYA